MPSTPSRKRRLRRTAKAVIKHGKSAKRKHKEKTGRTGQIMEKKNHSKKNSGYAKKYRFEFPNFVEVE